MRFIETFFVIFGFLYTGCVIYWLLDDDEDDEEEDNEEKKV